MRGVIVAAGLLLQRTVGFGEALKIWLEGLLEVAGMAIVGMVFLCVPLVAAYGTMWILSVLAGAWRRRGK